MSKTSRPELDLEGRCDCGAVTLAVHGRALSMFQCSCSRCQKVSGTGHASAVLVPGDAVEITGETKSFARPAESGATLTRHFCPACGTTVFAQSSRAPDIRILPVGIFAGSNDWFAPNQLIFAASHPPWDVIPPDLPRHEAYRPEDQP
jgi:hypothetical protein